MPRPLRPIDDGLVYHVINRGNNRQDVFHKPADFQAFLIALAELKERKPFALYGYCLLNNHFHLLLRPHGSLGYLAPAVFAARCAASAPKLASATPQPNFSATAAQRSSLNPNLHSNWYRNLMLANETKLQRILEIFLSWAEAHES